MLGFDAVGRLALGQIGQAGVTTLSLAAVTGAIVVAGKPATFSYSAVSGATSYSVTGNAAVLTTKLLAAPPGAFSVNGWPVIPTVGVGAFPGAFTVSGYDSSYTLVRESWYPTPGSSEVWIGATVPTDIWTPVTIQPDSWTEIPAP